MTHPPFRDASMTHRDNHNPLFYKAHDASVTHPPFRDASMTHRDNHNPLFYKARDARDARDASFHPLSHDEDGPPMEAYLDDLAIRQSAEEEQEVLAP